MAFLEDRNKSAGVTAPADPKSVDGLIAWLRTKNPAQEYDWFDYDGGCLIGQYQHHCLGTVVGSRRKTGYRGYFGDVTDTFNDIASECPRTMGGALQRAIALQVGAK